ncbi:hypothetical protein GJ744_000982 [Endocarpon pusillum]|uniref:Uncharacterized protein n=1 Tax=Endocarpon pusillum TaxID=364733 RepID=A0A8H7E3L9_9EURO|nr:hypothetical protein GJ744_000982 [Endocarpon pusillum]
MALDIETAGLLPGHKHVGEICLRVSIHSGGSISIKGGYRSNATISTLPTQNFTQQRWPSRTDALRIIFD